MIEQIIDIFWLRDYYRGDKVPKNKFYKQDDFTASYEKLFTQAVDSITLLAVLNKSNINIYDFVDEEKNYIEIYFLCVSLKTEVKYKEVLNIIHSILPKPCLMVLEYQNQICISTAHKRYSKAEKDTYVVEWIQDTGFIDIWWSDIVKDFLPHLKIQQQSYKDFYAFYSDLDDKLLLYIISSLTSRYTIPEKSSINQLRVQYDIFKNKTRDLLLLENEYKQLVNLWDQAKLFMKIKICKKELEDIRWKMKYH